MKDSVVQVTVAGLIGAVLMDVFIFLVLLFGIKLTPPWTIAADVFLSPGFVETTSGRTRIGK